MAARVGEPSHRLTSTGIHRVADQSTGCPRGTRSSRLRCDGAVMALAAATGHPRAAGAKSSVLVIVEEDFRLVFAVVRYCKTLDRLEVVSAPKQAGPRLVC